ncbi:MAG: hypothetical protein PF795_00975, partial [Kiritimatiellae bacterium]|nr:hypothetical protein [Kiritimatiellia bacterium]
MSILEIFMRLLHGVFLGLFGVALSTLAESPPEFEVFLGKVLRENPDISRQVFLVRAVDVRVEASGNS